MMIPVFEATDELWEELSEGGWWAAAGLVDKFGRMPFDPRIVWTYGVGAAGYRWWGGRAERGAVSGGLVVGMMGVLAALAVVVPVLMEGIAGLRSGSAALGL